jgi:hypothetical protein
VFEEGEAAEPDVFEEGEAAEPDVFEEGEAAGADVFAGTSSAVEGEVAGADAFEGISALGETSGAPGPELPTLGPELENSLAGVETPEIPALAPEVASDLDQVTELNRLFGEKVQANATMMREALARGDDSLLEQWLSPREFASYLRGDMQSANIGKAIERMVAADLALDSNTAPFFAWVSGSGQPDFYGIGAAEGFFWDVTTELDQFAHEEELYRWYASRTFVWGYAL